MMYLRHASLDRNDPECVDSTVFSLALTKLDVNSWEAENVGNLKLWGVVEIFVYITRNLL